MPSDFPGALALFVICRPRARGRRGPGKLQNVPLEPFNTLELANAAYLLDWRETDGRYCLLYSGTVDRHPHAGRGDCRVGIAWSRDLITWSVGR